MTLNENPREEFSPDDNEAIERLSRDLRNAAQNLTEGQARYLVDAYYSLQDYRIAAAAQVRAMNKDGVDGVGEPNEIIQWLFKNTDMLEGQIQAALDKYSNSKVVGRWMRSICGIGPVIAAGLLAHIDPEKTVTAGDLWSFAGLNPDMVWEKKTKRPFNAKLKVLAWKIGESFVKVQNRDSDVYGKVYAARKLLEIERNERGDFAGQAAAKLEKFKIGKDTEAYKHYSAGRLPPAHIHARARRYSVKLFLAHLQHVMYENHFHKTPPKPYVIEHLGHCHFITPPNWPMAS